MTVIANGKWPEVNCMKSRRNLTICSRKIPKTMTQSKKKAWSQFLVPTTSHKKFVTNYVSGDLWKFCLTWIQIRHCRKTQDPDPIPTHTLGFIDKTMVRKDKCGASLMYVGKHTVGRYRYGYRYGTVRYRTYTTQWLDHKIVPYR